MTDILALTASLEWLGVPRTSRGVVMLRAALSAVAGSDRLPAKGDVQMEWLHSAGLGECDLGESRPLLHAARMAFCFPAGLPHANRT